MSRWRSPAVPTLAAATLAGVAWLVSVTPAAADCGMAANEAFFSRSQGRDGGPVVTAAFFGIVGDRAVTRGAPVYRIDVGQRVAGAPMPGASWMFHGSSLCIRYNLNVGQTYLFIAGPGRATADTAIVIETFDPAWRTATVPHPTLDGKELPVEPEALLAYLRAKLSGLPATDASPPVPQEPLVRLLLVGAGLAGAAAWFSRRRRVA